MANITLAWQNRTDEGTLSNGSWLSTLPLTNLQDRTVQKVARSTNANLTSTKFDIDLASARSIGVVALVVHNVSVVGKIRITGDDASDFLTPVYQTAWIDCWPSGQIPQSLLEWEEDNFWLGTLSSNARAGYQSPFIHLLPTAQVLRYWRVEIDDTANSDGYLQVGRLFMSAAWTPTLNYTLGATLGYTDQSPVDTSLSGAEFFDVRSRAREFDLALDGLTDSEAYDYALQIQRLAGTTGEVLVIPDSADTTRVAIRSYLGRLVGLSPVEQVQQNRHRVGFRLRELL